MKHYQNHRSTRLIQAKPISSRAKLLVLMLTGLLSIGFSLTAHSSVSAGANAVADAKSAEVQEHKAKTLEIYRTVIGIPTVAGRGNGQTIVDYLTQELRAAGFPEEAFQTVAVDDAIGLTVRYAGEQGSRLKPILLLAHMDVVEALDSDWERPPFTLTEDDDYYYGRGTTDNKYGATILTSTFIRLKKQGFVPNRDIYLVFTGDEETTMFTTNKLAYEAPYLSDAEYALNSDGGGGVLDSNHQPIAFRVQSAEKTYATFSLTFRNQGGHSSLPRPDNAVYDLTTALGKLANYDFPVMSSEVTRDYFRQVSSRNEGEVAVAMMNFANNPNDAQAISVLSAQPHHNAQLRTTCVATMINAGHAENALAQSATATINCRIFPGVEIDEVKQQLTEVIANDRGELELAFPYPASPTSEPREDIMAALGIAVGSLYPDVPLIPTMSTGMTDGAIFRSAGIPTWGVRNTFMRPEDNFAHGLNERLPKKAFADGLKYWTVLLRTLTGPAE